MDLHLGGGMQQQVGGRLAPADSAGRKQPAAEEAQEACQFQARLDTLERRRRCDRLRSADPGQCSCHVRDGSQLPAHPPQRFVPNPFGEILGQPAAGRLLDRAKDVGGPSAVKAARQILRWCLDTHRGECPRQHCARDQLAVDEHTVAIEDDHWSPRCLAEWKANCPAVKTQQGDDNQRLWYSKTAAEPQRNYAQELPEPVDDLRRRRASFAPHQLNLFLTSSMPRASRSSATFPLAAVARIFSAAATAASAAAERTSARACASA